MIERVCVVGAGVIGSLYAAHLSRVADVWVLTRRPEHARALEEDGLTVTGRADFTGRLHATDDPARAAGVRRRDRGDEGDGARRRGRARSPAASPSATVVTVQNGLGAEQIVRRHGDWPLVSGVTFMSGTRHDDTHVEYILDTETWLGPYNGIPYDRVEELAGADRALRAEGARVPRSAPGAVVEADLQRDRERGRGADRAPARPRTSRPRSGRPTSATSSTRSSTRARPSRRPPGSSCTRTRGR